MNRIEAAANARKAKAKNQPRIWVRFWSKVDKRGREECWPWTASVRRKDDGYGAFWLNGKHQPSNRIAYLLTFGRIPKGMVVCHVCDNPKCCNPAHLFISTAKGNNDDKVSKKRHCFGESIRTSKLTEKDVLDIKAMKPTGRAPTGLRGDLSKKYNVKKCTIDDVWRRTWKHLD